MGKTPLLPFSGVDIGFHFPRMVTLRRSSIRADNLRLKTLHTNQADPGIVHRHSKSQQSRASEGLW